MKAIQVLQFGETTPEGHRAVVEAVDGTWRLYLDENGDPAALHVPTNASGKVLSKSIRHDLKEIIKGRESIPTQE